MPSPPSHVRLLGARRSPPGGDAPLLHPTARSSGATRTSPARYYSFTPQASITSGMILGSRSRWASARSRGAMICPYSSMVHR
jgi:hypothetical protein